MARKRRTWHEDLPEYFLSMLLGAAAVAQPQSAANNDTVIEQYRNQLAQHPDNSELISRLAQKLEEQGRWREAMPCWSA